MFPPFLLRLDVYCLLWAMFISAKAWSLIWPGREAFFGDFLLAVAFVERASSSARTMPFLFRLAGGDPGGFRSGIGEAKLSDFKP
jgi:hypothetical protein